jgi:hypothetical protein
METVESLVRMNPNCTFIFCGDYNLPCFTWSNDSDGLIYSSSSGASGSCVPETFASLNFFQRNFVLNSTQSTLDLLFSNINTVAVERSLNPLVPCDSFHPALEISLLAQRSIPYANNSHTFFDFRNADYSKIISFLNSYNWPETLQNQDVNSAAYCLYDALHSSILNFVPESLYTQSKFPLWYTKELKTLVFAKKQAHAAFKASHNRMDYSAFSFLRARFKYMSKKCYKAYLLRTESQILNHPKKFWKFVNRRRSNSGIPNLMHLDDLHCSGKEQIANMFSTYFCSVFKPPHSTATPNNPFLYHSLPSNSFFSVSDIESKLNELSTTKSAGPDGIPGSFLANIKSAISIPLWIIFRRSLDEGIFPDIWKMSSVTPIHKTGEQDNIRNYRPISILSHLAKLFECLVVRSIQPLVNSILTNAQYGFRPNRSSTLNSIVFNNYILSALESHSQVDAIFTDISKAFDQVDHIILIDILYKSGFGEPLLSWFKSYLYLRTQWVKVLDCRSAVTNITSGVPQGGHLSPILFALFINGLNNALRHCRFLAFADDVKLFLQIDSENDCFCLQSELNSLAVWLNNHGLSLNVGKCQVMSFTRRQSPIIFDYSLKGQSLLRVTIKKDLGILLTSNLDYHSHIEHVTCKSLKTLGFIKRISNEFKLTHSLKNLYCALVRPIIEYGSVLWDPYTSSDSYQLERVQRKFLNFASFCLNIEHDPHDYSPILRHLKLSSLSDRRELANLSFLNKLVNNAIDAPELLAEINFRVPCRFSRLSAPYYVPLHHTNYGRNQPIHRIMRLANENLSNL